MAADPKQVVEASRAMENLSEQSLAAVAESKGMTVQQLRVRLDQKLLELADHGDLQAIQLLSERCSGATLGRLERVRSAKSLLRRVLRGLADGRITVNEAAKLGQLVRLRRELERDDLDARLAEVEGSLVERVDG